MDMDISRVLGPLYNLVPEVAKPKKKIPLREKLVWTFCALVIYLVCSQIPLLGTAATGGIGSYNPLNVLLASNRGSLVEIGIEAIVNSGMVVQVLGIVGSDSTQKFGCALVAFVFSAYGVYSGKYGAPRDLGLFACSLIFAQLFAGGMLVILLDDLLQKGYGIVSGVSLFVAANSSERIISGVFSPMWTRGGEYQGAILQVLSALKSQNKLEGLGRAFFRQDAPNMMNAFSTVLMFAAITYLQGFRVEIPIQSSRARGLNSTYPIRLFYTNTVPIMLQSVFVTNLLLIAQKLARRNPGNWLVRLLGKWEMGGGYAMRPVGGLCYYISTPGSLYHALIDPFHTAFYVAFTLSSCALVSVMWTTFSGGSATEVARELRERGMIIKGHRENATIHELNRYIPTAALLGGICVGAITIVADLLDSIGSGTGILLAVSTIQQISELLAKESIM